MRAIRSAKRICSEDMSKGTLILYKEGLWFKYIPFFFSKATPIMGKIKCLNSSQRIKCFQRTRILPSSFSTEIYDTAGIFISHQLLPAPLMSLIVKHCSDCPHQGSWRLLPMVSGSCPYVADLSLIKILVACFLNHFKSLGFLENWAS